MASVRRQTYHRVEVVVVDAYSSDGTVEVARRFGARVYRVRGERSAQKNFGARVARGDYVYFIDSDFVLHPRVVEECVGLVSRGFDAVVVVNYSWPRPSVVARARFFERLSYVGSGVYEAARFIRRDLFLLVGGFDESLYANEDYDLHARLIRAGARIARTKYSYEIHIGEPRSVREYIVKSLYYGRSLSRYFSKNPNPLHALPLRPTFFRREFISVVGRAWPQGLILVPFFKLLQAYAALIGRLFKLQLNPYG